MNAESTSAPAARAVGDGLRWGFVINLVGRSAVVASSAAISLLLARHYGAETFGRWSVAAAYATLVGTLLDGGFHRVMMRDVGRTPEAARGVLWNVVKRRLQIASGAVPIALLIAAVAVGNVRAWLLIALLVCARFTSDLVGTFSSVMFAFERFRRPNAVEMLRRSVLLAVVVVLVIEDVSVEWVAVATLALSIAGSGAIVRPALRLVADKTAPMPVSHWSDAAWFWVNGVLFWINAEVDQLMIAWLSDTRSTGLYAAAVRLVALCLIIPKTVNDTVIRRWFRAGSKVDGHMALTTFLLSGVGGLIGLQFALFSREIIALAYSSQYDAAAPAFAVLGCYLFLNFARSAPHWFISTSDRVPLATSFLAIAAVANVVANLWLIPAFGALGAAYSTAACELLLLCLAYVAAGRRAPKLIVAAVLGAVPALLALGAAYILRSYVPWFVAGIVATIFGGGVLALSARRQLASKRP